MSFFFVLFYLHPAARLVLQFSCYFHLYFLSFVFFFLLKLELPEHNVFSLACLSLTWKHSFHFVSTQKYRLYTNEKQRETFNVFCPWI